MTVRTILSTALVFAALAMAAPSAQAIDEKVYGTVRYLSGGVGEDEKQEIIDRAAQYTFRITTAHKKSGDFLADCKVTVTKGNQTVLEAVMDGPVLLAKLDPGTYRLRAEFENKPQDRQFTVGRTGMVSLYLYWD
ncbi:MAG: hypothetical protein JNK67_06035 [Alphaproteobacteria bacterium]|nr:hypothetical protein [Alphaproteobacteria bacterium]